MKRLTSNPPSRTRWVSGWGGFRGRYFTTGDRHSRKPQGIVIAEAGTGVTAASTTTFTAAELISLFFKIDPAYRESKSFGWMMNDAVLAFIAGLTDSTGRPLFQQSYREGAPDMVLSKPVYTNQFMDSAFTTGKKLVLCGDFSKYIDPRRGFDPDAAA
jgi:HK97 family phage major capsid protein